MKIFTKYSSDGPLLQECDLLLLFSEHGGLTFSQIDYAVEATFYKIPIVTATATDTSRSCSAYPDHCWLADVENVGDAILALNALVGEFGFQAIGNLMLSKVGRLAEALRSSGSPIETKLLLAMFLHTFLLHAQEFYTQHSIGPYRADIAIVTHGHKVVVEADGHSFHERTRQQAQHDKQRDREMQTLGWRVMRFTGSEIHKDPALCATQVQELLHALMKGAA